MKKIYFFIFAFLSFSGLLFSQELDGFDVNQLRVEMGDEEEIFMGDIDPSVLEEARDAVWELEQLLDYLINTNLRDKRRILREEIERASKSIVGDQDVLLTRFMLDRALKLDSVFGESGDNDQRVVEDIFTLAIRHAAKLYEKDAEFFKKVEGQTELDPFTRPAYISLTKSTIGYILNASDVVESYSKSYQILKLGIMWALNDLWRAKARTRQLINEVLYDKLLTESESFKEDPFLEVEPQDLTRMRDLLLDVYEQVQVEDGVTLPDCLPQPNKANFEAINKPRKLSAITHDVSYVSGLEVQTGVGMTEGSTFNGEKMSPEAYLTHSFTFIDVKDANPFENLFLDLLIAKAITKRKFDDPTWSHSLESHFLKLGAHMGSYQNRFGLVGTVNDHYKDGFKNLEVEESGILGLSYRHGHFSESGQQFEFEIVKPINTELFLVGIEPGYASEGWKNTFQNRFGREASYKDIQDNIESHGVNQDAIRARANYKQKSYFSSVGNVLFEAEGYYADAKLQFDKVNWTPEFAHYSKLISPYVSELDRDIDSWGARVRLEFLGQSSAFTEMHQPEIKNAFVIEGFMDSARANRELMRLYNPGTADGLVKETRGVSLYWRIHF